MFSFAGKLKAKYSFFIKKKKKKKKRKEKSIYIAVKNSIHDRNIIFQNKLNSFYHVGL